MSVESIGADVTTSRGAILTSGTVTHSKGAWVELTASLGANAQGIIVVINNGSAACDYLVDIGVGAASSEAVVIANLPFQTRASLPQSSCYYIPLPFTAGDRISARVSSSGAVSDPTCTVTAYLVSTTVKLEEVTSVNAYGGDISDTGGIEIDPGATAHTKGSWVEIDASLDADVKFITFMVAGKTDTARALAGWLVDIGTGAGGAEAVVVADLAIEAHASDLVGPACYPPIPVTIASGTRLAVRAQCSINTAGDRLFDAIIITANGTASGGGASFHAALR